MPVTVVRPYGDEIRERATRGDRVVSRPIFSSCVIAFVALACGAAGPAPAERKSDALPPGVRQILPLRPEATESKSVDQLRRDAKSGAAGFTAAEGFDTFWYTWVAVNRDTGLLP